MAHPDKALAGVDDPEEKQRIEDRFKTIQVRRLCMCMHEVVARASERVCVWAFEGVAAVCGVLSRVVYLPPPACMLAAAAETVRLAHGQGPRRASCTCQPGVWSAARIYSWR